jgi:hypothetical protein
VLVSSDETNKRIKYDSCHYRTVGEEMSEIFKSLQELENSRTATALSPHTEKRKISSEMQMV